MDWLRKACEFPVLEKDMVGKYSSTTSIFPSPKCLKVILSYKCLSSYGFPGIGHITVVYTTVTFPMPTQNTISNDNVVLVQHLLYHIQSLLK